MTKYYQGKIRSRIYFTPFIAVILVAAALLFSSCGSGSKNITKVETDSTSVGAKSVDPFAALDDKQGGVDPTIFQERLEVARQEWLRALSAEQRKDKSEVVKRFENSIDILNRLIYYPGVSENKDFQELSRSVMEDYEKYVSDIDVLPPNASIFAFRQKFNEEIAKTDIKKLNIPKPPDLTHTQVPLPMNEFVEKSIAYFLEGNGRNYMQKWLGRSGKFFPMMHKIFKDEGVPEELIHLSMIESGMNPTVTSKAQAVGLWQFIQGTGAMYGLKSNWWLDNRRDPVKSTRAAARHLRDLYRAMGDWHLALSCYNCSMTRIKRCMAESGDTTFWGIRPCLPKETQNYIPLYIAATIIASDPARYGFTNIAYDKPVPFDTVRIYEAVDINALGTASGVSGLEIKDLNPELLQPSTPPKEIIGGNGYLLHIPEGKTQQFAANFVKLTPEEKRPWLVHTVERGESLRSIARTYGLTPEQLADYNNMGATEKVHAGTRLRVPMSVMAPSTIASTENTNVTAPASVPAPKKSSKVIHRVRRGETLATIASRYGVRSSDIRNWNNLSFRHGLRKGQALAIYIQRGESKSVTSSSDIVSSKKTQHHKVRRGETLAKIADDYGVTVSQLRAWNGKSVKHGVKAGQTLTINQNLATVTAPAPQGKARMHKVRPGETMTSIARSYGTTVEKLSEWNDGKDAASLQAGQTLKVFGSNNTTAKGDSEDSRPAARQKNKHYRVRRGDTLFSIAEKYGIGVSDLKSANNLRKNSIPAGKTLVIPAE